MALTARVKSELSTVVVPKMCCRRSEIATTLRFAGGVHLVSGHIVIEAELDSGGAARRLRQAIQEIYSLDPDVVVVRGSGIHQNTRYVLRLARGGGDLARLTGLIDRHGRPVRGLPTAVVGGGQCCQAAAWRGAFLARGSLTEPGRSMAMEITAPGSESAMALVGAARRLDIPVKSRQARHVERVVIRDGDAIAAMLTWMGAHESLLAWEDRRLRREVRASANRLANFDDANLRRSARAAVTASARVRRALEILGDDVPDHLLEAGRLRLDNGNASLEELGRLHVPPLTKDAVAGRIRRLLATADKAARARGIPTTLESLPAEIRDEHS
ncbi:DNA-binding protein WhiA [Acidipropionibacterium jensenii]|uniref:DNA-binding protein WhiA n=1 Tax=Acidipropionibacterium jensenii TaxID=1749 RepID=UPI000BC30791|nr:DNA-binding protein WhiA [Acidipropionibacterium jensenii]AZZ41844.1 DNA-binding protein WhiA [Acidipropionibacterium jensenii]